MKKVKLILTAIALSFITMYASANTIPTDSKDVLREQIISLLGKKSSCKN